MKTLNFEIVRQEFFNLLFKNRKTTSLDVKLALREKGYFAKQNEISNFISRITPKDYIPYFVVNNGKYNEYFITNNVDEFMNGIMNNFLTSLKF